MCGCANVCVFLCAVVHACVSVSERRRGFGRMKEERGKGEKESRLRVEEV